MITAQLAGAKNIITSPYTKNIIQQITYNRKAPRNLPITISNSDEGEVSRAWSVRWRFSSLKDFIEIIGVMNTIITKMLEKVGDRDDEFAIKQVPIKNQPENPKNIAITT
jgi:hypothetical protein